MRRHVSGSRREARFASFILIMVMSGAVSSPATAEPRINWGIENPFRLFGVPELTQMHADALGALTDEEKKTPVLSVERRLSALYARGWAAKAFRKDGAATCYNPTTDTYGDIPAGKEHHAACKDYILPASHRIAVQLADPPDGTATCTWKREFPGQPAEEKSAACGAKVTLDIPYKLNASGKAVESKLSVAAGGLEIAKINLAIRDALVVGLGDSFGSGEGNPDMPIEFNDARSLSYGKVGNIELKGRPARVGEYPNWSDFVRLEGNPGFYENRERWWDRQCHRSLYSHQVRVALQLALEDPHRAVTFVSYSCSGAEVIDGLISRKATSDCTPNLGDNVLSTADLPAQVSALAGALCVPGKLTRDKPIPSVMTRRPGNSPPFPFLPSDGAGDWKKIDRCERTNGQPSLKRQIDLVLLSVGGNDIGFSGIVADAILAPGTPYRKLAYKFKVLKTEADARKALKVLRDKYFVTYAALKFLFGVGGGPSSRMSFSRPTRRWPIASRAKSAPAQAGSRRFRISSTSRPRCARPRRASFQICSR